MSSVDATLELLGACRVLFGTGVRPDQEFLAKLDLDSVRRSFRKRAVEVHPDRAAVLQRHPVVLAEAFKQLEAAYRTLREHLAEGHTKASAPAARPTQSAGPAQPSSACDSAATGSSSAGAATADVKRDHFWSGPVPSRPLRLGEFLYYSGRIPWSELIHAVAWQSRQAPRFGQLAYRFGYLTPQLIAAVLERRQAREKIGEAALRLGLITCLQQRMVLQAQQRGRRRIGEYFIQAGLLRGQDLESFGRSVRAHNARIALGK